jgi:hypothetical protein
MARRDRTTRLVVVAMQILIAAMFGLGILDGDPRIIVNAGLAFVGTFIPTVLARDLRVYIGPAATIWITGALCLHVFGMVGAYESIGWWDHLTHFVSASLVAAIAYTTVTAIDRHVEDLFLPPWTLAVLLTIVTVGLGVLWEVMEFLGRALAVELGTDTLLVQYGLDDTMLDLAVDAVGGVLIAIVGPARLEGAVTRVENRFFVTDPTQNDID